uniref:Growth arrest specific 7 n=1 Tax=Chrysolophus pictus TaxID=9089 RepID=A0A8C3LF92_CHRPC
MTSRASHTPLRQAVPHGRVTASLKSAHSASPRTRAAPDGRTHAVPWGQRRCRQHVGIALPDAGPLLRGAAPPRAPLRRGGADHGAAGAGRRLVGRAEGGRAARLVPGQLRAAPGETTWERPSSVPGTPKSPVTQQSPVNGYHISGTPVHQLDSTHMNLRKASGDPQTPGSPAAPRRQSKESSLTINCVTFPHPDIMPEQQLLKPSEWSYCDYFWADKKDSQGNNTVSGFEILLQKQLKGKQMQKEMAEFVRERIKIEEEYAKNLSKLSQNSLAAQEEGTLGEAWAQLKKSLADEAEVHLKFSSKLQSEVEKPLLNFRENFKKDMKKCDHHIADLRKQLASRYAAVEKARKALTERQKDLEMKTQQLEVKLSNKTEEEIKKARRKSTQAGDDLMRCVDLYNQAQSKWFEEMVTTTLELERLEVERVEMIRQHLCQYTQLRHETDMFNQSTVELVDQLLRKYATWLVLTSLQAGSSDRY